MGGRSVIRTLPYAWYADPAALRVEQDRIFARTWQYATRAELVTEPGTMTPTWAGTLPVLLVRGQDGELRGFVNVCRHRGHVLCEAADRRETIQCRYHAWTYDLDGSLRSAPRAEQEDAFDRGSISLVPVSVEAWGPFVFVNPDPDAEPLTEALGALPTLLADGGVDVGALRFHSRAESDEYACNWKVCAENFLECYHCAVAHPSLAKTLDVSQDAYVLQYDGALLSQFGPPSRLRRDRRAQRRRAPPARAPGLPLRGTARRRGVVQGRAVQRADLRPFGELLAAQRNRRGAFEA